MESLEITCVGGGVSGVWLGIMVEGLEFSVWDLSDL